MRSTLALLASLSLSGCIHYLPAAVSSTGLGEHERPIRVTTGHSSAFYFFGLGPFGNDSLAAAIEDAQGDAPGDTMANVFVDRRIITVPSDYLPLIVRIDTMITGTLIKYENEPGFKRAPAVTKDSAQVEPSEPPVQSQPIDSQSDGSKVSVRKGRIQIAGDAEQIRAMMRVVPKNTLVELTTIKGERFELIFMGTSDDGRFWFRGRFKGVWNGARKLLDPSEIKEIVTLPD